MLYGMIILILLVAGVLASGIYCFVRRQRREKERKLCYEAAARLIQEEYLDYSIHNYREHPVNPPERKKIMLYLQEKSNRKNGHVFDPLKIIRIGRNRKGNDICIQEASVSGNHCCIYLHQSKIVLQDQGSANGTLIKRGRKKKWLSGESLYLQDRDQIYVGCVWFEISIFCYDQKYM